MKKTPNRRRTPLFEVRHSSIHGYGVFAARRIRKGTAVIEYLGERVSHLQADERYEYKDPNDNHTFLFTVDEKIVIDAGVNGNEARYVNHGCDPNCESAILNKRVFIIAMRTIQPGEELSYDYQIQRDCDDAHDVDDVYACRCGAGNCRGSMLEARKRASAKARKAVRRAPGRVAGKNGRKRAVRRGSMAARTQRRGG
jgi:SET domain-containing protein